MRDWVTTPCRCCLVELLSVWCGRGIACCFFFFQGQKRRRLNAMSHSWIEPAALSLEIQLIEGGKRPVRPHEERLLFNLLLFSLPFFFMYFLFFGAFPFF